MNRMGLAIVSCLLLLGRTPARAQDAVPQGAPLPAATLPEGVAQDGVAAVDEEIEPVADWNMYTGVSVWGLADGRVMPKGDRMAPNGVPYDPLFSLGWTMNIGLKCCPRFYIFTEDRFWAQKPGHGIAPGVIDFSKREFDLDIGGAYNYCGNWEFRTFAYSLNNLNRGKTLEGPWGYKDGVGLENRYYFGGAYSRPVETKYDVARTNFVSIGYLPTKQLIGGDGIEFKPGGFLRAYLTYDILGEKLYAFGDGELIGMQKSFNMKLLNVDLGAASRPFESCNGLEFRMGAENVFDLEVNNTRTFWYFAVRFLF